MRSSSATPLAVYMTTEINPPRVAPLPLRSRLRRPDNVWRFSSDARGGERRPLQAASWTGPR